MASTLTSHHFQNGRPGARADVSSPVTVVTHTEYRLVQLQAAKRVTSRSVRNDLVVSEGSDPFRRGGGAVVRES